MGLPLPSPDRIQHPAMAEIAELTRCFNPVELLTIDRVAEVREDFLRRRSNPTFTYERSTAALVQALARHGLTVDAVEARLHRLADELCAEAEDELGDLIQGALREKIEDDLLTIDLFRGLSKRDDFAVKRAVVSKYGSVSDALHRTATLIDTRTDLHAELGPAMSAHELADAMRWMLARYYAAYEEKTGRPFPQEAKYRVAVDAKYASIDVRDKSSEGPVIGIPPLDRSCARCLALLRHEIDQHARQSLNGRLMFGFGGGALKVDDEIWYEGLAKQREIQFMGEMLGSEPAPPLPYYVFAIRLADEGKSFVEVFEAIREIAGEANAWTSAYRIFRGHSDTTNTASFGLPKDKAYLEGWMLQRELDAQGLSHLNEAAVSRIDGIQRIARFDFGPEDLLFPDLNLTAQWFQEVVR